MQKNDSIVKVLIVDDSAIMRQVLTQILQTSPRIEVVGFAKDGREALEKTRELHPHVITLDVEMPIMSGLEALPGLVGIFQKPVVMVSSLTQEGAEKTFQSLELGAVDFVPKPINNTIQGLRIVADDIINKVLNAAGSQIRIVPGSCIPSTSPALPSAKPRIHREEPGSHLPSPKIKANGRIRNVVVIGISTGGPQALSETLIHIKPPVPPILIVQHMPAKFTNAFATRLDRHCSVHVKEAISGERLHNDTIYIAPGGLNMRVKGNLPDKAFIEISDDESVSGHKPSADALFESVVPIFGPSVVGILMTGMGRDGVRGLKAIKDTGGTTFGQDEATSTVYGMNKAAFLEGAVQKQFAIAELPEILMKSWLI